MIRNPNSLHTDQNRKELLEQGELFNLTANHGDIHHYITDCIPSHWHRELELFLLLEGSVLLRIEDRVYHINAGEGGFINTGVLHTFTADSPCPCIFRSFVFDSGIAGGTPGSVFDTVYIRPILETGPSFLKFQKNPENEPYFRQFGQAFTACAGEQPGYEFKIRAALSEVLLFIWKKSQMLPPRKMPDIQEARIKRMLEYIDANISNAMTVKEIADTVSICPRECQRIFGRYLHYSPMAYVQRRRIFTAARLLSETNSPLTEIALSCGFQSPSYFSKQFKQLTGSTPREYRAAVRKNK